MDFPCIILERNNDRQVTALVKKGDILLSAFFVVTAVVMLICTFWFKEDGKKAVISVDGKVYGEFFLSEDQTFEISTEKGKNTVTIKGGKVTVSEADCPDKYCVNHVAVDSTGETIVCLPHRVIIEIKE